MLLRRIVLAGLIAGLFAFAACGGDSAPRAKRSPTPSRTVTVSASPTFAGATPPDCKPPKKVSFPTWVPDDLPLPDGIYAYRHLGKISGYQRALFVIPMGSTDFAKMVIHQWPKAGYVLGRGDSEPGEVEDNFSKSPAVGAFKANDVFCTPGYTIMYLIYAKNGPQVPVPTPTLSASGSPLTHKH